MSCTIREYVSADRMSNETLIVTAYVARDGAGVQLTIGNHYCVLSEAAVSDLVLTLQRSSIEREINYRRMVLRAAEHCGCSDLPSIAENRSEIVELEQIRANLEAIHGRVK